MNREEIIQIATESWLTEYGRTLLLRGFDIEINIEELERFAALVAAAAVRETSAEYRMGWNDGQINEREACAKLCEESNDMGSSYGLAQAIRARSNT